MRGRRRRWSAKGLRVKSTIRQSRKSYYFVEWRILLRTGMPTRGSCFNWIWSLLRSWTGGSSEEINAYKQHLISRLGQRGSFTDLRAEEGDKAVLPSRSPEDDKPQFLTIGPPFLSYSTTIRIRVSETVPDRFLGGFRTKQKNWIVDLFRQF